MVVTKAKVLCFSFFVILFIVINGCIGLDCVWADIFHVYHDSGIPYRSELCEWCGSGGSFQEIPDQEAPERVKYAETISQNWSGWGIFFRQAWGNCEPEGIDYSLDLSNYSQGNLKFFVKTAVDLKVELQEIDRYGPKHTKYISNYGWNGQNEWQEISIPINDFQADLTQIYVPFMITAESPATFYVDYVRWTVPISGYTPIQVEVDGRQLLVNGEVFTVKGVSAEFTPVGQYGSGYDWSLFPENYTPDIPIIRDMGANVIRTYHNRPTQIEALDNLYDQEIYVIMGFPVDTVYGSGQVVDFRNDTVRENIKARFLDMVEHWKDHPAILMWCFGNEINRAIENEVEDLRHAWYSLVNECAQEAHSLDNSHLITTANSDQVVWDIGNPAINADDASLEHLDLWSVQLYRGLTFGDAFINYENLSNKPLLISEFGCDAWNGLIGEEDEEMQADYLDSQWSHISENLSSIDESNVCVGGIVFSWRDGWWKSTYGTPFTHDTLADWYNGAYEDPNMNEEWWGVVAISENPEERIIREGYFIWTTPNTPLNLTVEAIGEYGVHIPRGERIEFRITVINPSQEAFDYTAVISVDKFNEDTGEWELLRPYPEYQYCGTPTDFHIEPDRTYEFERYIGAGPNTELAAYRLRTYLLDADGNQVVGDSLEGTVDPPLPPLGGQGKRSGKFKLHKKVDDVL